MDESISKTNSIEVMIDGKKYPSIRQAAIAKKLPPYVVYNRISLYGMSKEEALSKPIKKPASVVIKGVKYPSLKNAFEKIGKVSFSTYQFRRHKVVEAKKSLQHFAEYIVGLNSKAP
ncbi:hypothetical protein [Billgrantia endophytica]|uniref:hypothetical protein n=1 Tax=Billgrantia endophytica TaxID=2033802 RepID=UPI0010567632|nr:hypothetical protein [Halomonas endophytica]